MDKDFIEVSLANGFKVVISTGEGTYVALENPNGFIVSSTKMTKEQEDFLVKNLKCNHTNVETWNHGYHNRCKICGEEDVIK